MKSEFEVAGETPNGREIRAVAATMKTEVFFVQPANDNFWLCCASEAAARQAYHSPHKFAAKSDRLKKKYDVSM